MTPRNPCQVAGRISPLRAALLSSILLSTLLAQSQRPPAPPEAEKVLRLDPFLVETSDERYSNKDSNTGSIIAMDRNAIPFTTSIITEDMIDDMRIDNPSDLAELIAGVSRDVNPYVEDIPGETSLTYRVRGFTNDPLYNGFQTGGRILASDNLGRVEVSKGPNSVLYGQAPAGGIINFVPKQARFKDHGKAVLGAGTNEYYRASVDAGGPLKNGKVAFRLGGTYMTHQREQPYFQSDVHSFYGAVTFRLSERVSVDLQAEQGSNEIVPSRTAAFVSAGAGPLRRIDPYNRVRNTRNFSYSGPYSIQRTDTLLSTAYINTKLSQSLTLRVGGFFSQQVEDSNTLNNVYGLAGAATAQGTYDIDWVQKRTRAAKADLLHSGSFFGFDVKTLLGFEAHEEEANLTRRQTPSFPVTIPLTRPEQHSDWPVPPAENQYTVLATWRKDDLNWTNARLTQYISSKDEALNLLWGIARGDGETIARDRRLAAVSASDAADTTYTVGASYKFLNRGSQGNFNHAIFFANHSTSFQIQAGNQQDPSIFEGFTTVDALKDFIATVRPNSVEPQSGEGLEAGFRFGLLKDRLHVSAVYFDQTRENIARSFFVRASIVPGVTAEDGLASYLLAGGVENSKGWEFSFDWRPVKNLILIGEATLTEGRVEENPEAPEEVGFGLVRSPEDMYSAWIRYDFLETRFSGLSVGLGASYHSSARIRPQVPDRFRVSDPYTNMRAMIRYKFRAFNLDTEIGLNVDNVLDEEYTQEDNFLSEPRLYKFSVSTRF